MGVIATKKISHPVYHDLKFEEYGDADLEEILLLEQSAGPNPWDERHFRSCTGGHYLRVGLRADGKWLAQAVLSLVSPELEILCISVHIGYQGNGLGSILLMEIERALGAKIDTIWLEVRESNNAAIAFYDNAGFNQAGIRKNYYPSVSRSSNAVANDARKFEDALIYAKTICL